MNGKEAYILNGGEIGVLLIHGFTGIPGELKLLAEFLNKRNYTVKGVLLPGHGTSPQDLENKTWQQWYQQAKEDYFELKKICKEVYVIGLSMGALVAMKIAAELDVQKVVILAAPIYVYDSRVKLLRKNTIGLTKFFCRFLKKKKTKYLEIPKEYQDSYDLMPIKGVFQVMELVRHCKNEVLNKIKIPCLIIQSKAEHTVRPGSAKNIYENISSKEKELFWLEKSGHIVTLGEEREKVFKKINDFLGEK